MGAAIEYHPQCPANQVRSTAPFWGWLMITAGSGLFIALIVGAPLLAASGHNGAAVAIYRVFSRVCHQISERSFFVEGHPLAVCARCWGLYLGFAIGASIYPLLRPLQNTESPDRVWLLAAAVPTAIDYGLGFFGIFENTHTSRFITASLLGFVSVFYVVPGLIDLFLYCLKRWGFLKSANLTDVNQIRFTTLDGSAIASARSDYSSPGRRI
jgi:uncharacterized membrane protein